MDSRTVDPNLVFIRLARTMGYGLFSINVLILTEAQEALDVASSNFFARSILYFVCKRGKKTAACSECSFSRSKFMMNVSKNNNYLKYICSVSGEKFARVAHNSEKKKRMMSAYASNK